MLGRAQPRTPRGMGRWRLVIWGVIATLLIAPLLAMQFTNEVAWSGFDFAVASMLLIGAGAAYELVARRTSDTAYRLIGGGMILAVVLLIWADGAVGIF